MSARPRPRARPKAKAAEVSQTGSTPAASPVEAGSSSSTPSAGIAKKVAQREVSDDFFMKNTQTDKWIQMAAQREAAKLKALQKGPEPSGPEFDDDDDDDEESSGSKRRRRYIKSRSPNKKADDWTQDVNAIRTFDIDSEVEEVPRYSVDREGSSSKRLKSDSTAVSDERGRMKEKSRKRSPSLTPPPSLDALDKAKARLAVKDLYGASTIRPMDSYSVLDREDDYSFNRSLDTSSSNLAPELAAIAKNIKSRGSGTGASTQPTFGSDLWSTTLVGTGEKADTSSEVVIIKVKLTRHPREVMMASKPDKWAFKVNREDSLTPLFQEISRHTDIPTSQLVLRYNSKQIFQSSSPGLLKMRDSAEVDAYHKSTWEYLRQQPTTSLSSTTTPTSSTTQIRPGSNPKHAISRDDDDDEGTAANDSFVSSTSSAAPAEEKRLKLFLRSQKYPEKKITVLAKSTTLASALVTHYLKAVGLGEMSEAERRKKRVRLVVDGDDIPDDESIGDIGDGILEEGDVVDIHGL